MRIRLTFFEGSLAGESRDVEVSADQSATVGRGSHCDVILGEKDRTASSSHAKLWIKDGALYVTDIGSQYGLFVNGKAKMKARLQGSERIQFGFKGPAAIVTVGVQGPAPAAAPRRRPSRRKRPVAMTTVRAVPTELLKAESGGHRAPAKPPCPICRKELPRSYFRCLACKRTVCTTHFDPKVAVCSHCAASGQTLSKRGAAPRPLPAPIPTPAPPRIVVSAPTAAPGPPAGSANGEWKSCPFCAEKIRVAAIKCRFCGEFLPKAAAAAPSPPAPAPAAPPAAPSLAPRRIAATGVETFEVLDLSEPDDDLELVEDDASAEAPLVIERPLSPSTPPSALAPAPGTTGAHPPAAETNRPLPNAGQGTIVGMPTFEEDEEGEEDAAGPPAAPAEVEVVPEAPEAPEAPTGAPPLAGAPTGAPPLAGALPNAAKGTIVGMPIFDDDDDGDAVEV